MKGLPRSLARAPKTAPGLRRVTYNIKALQVAIIDPGAAIGYGAAAFATLPEGNILIVGAIANVILSSASAGIITTFTANFSVGNAATADATLSGNEVNIIPSSAVSAATAKVAPQARGANSTAVIIDNTAKDQNLQMNIIVPDASLSANSTMQVDGQVFIAFVVLGDD